MFADGARTFGGNVSGDIEGKINIFLKEFSDAIEEEITARKLRRGIVRTSFECSLLAILTRDMLFLAVQKHFGMPSSLYINAPSETFSIQQASEISQLDFGFEDPMIFSFARDLLELPTSLRANALHSIANLHVESELQRTLKAMNLIQLNPIFGTASYSLEKKLVFVLMPFSDELTRVYNSIVKPTIESTELGLVCRRADDYKTNKAIIQDIWKAICEARLVIADLTYLNPNVMYELGIAHTVGKETILIYQKSESQNIKFPFDIGHIRRIEYSNDAVGGKQLQDDLAATVKSILSPVTIS